MSKLAEFDAEQVASMVEAQGSAYVEYARNFRDNGVDGALVTSYVTGNTLHEMFADLDITKKLHINKLSVLFSSPQLVRLCFPKSLHCPACVTEISRVAGNKIIGGSCTLGGRIFFLSSR